MNFIGPLQFWQLTDSYYNISKEAANFDTNVAVVAVNKKPINIKEHSN